MSDILAHYYTHGFDLETDNNEGVILETLDDALLEDSWTDVIVEKDEMPRKLKIQQEVLWELLVTERNYLRRLKVITGVRLIFQCFDLIEIFFLYRNLLRSVRSVNITTTINPFVHNAPFLYSLKTSENRKVF